MSVKAIPDGYHTVTPLVTVKDVAKFLDFAKQAFGATEAMRMSAPDGSVAHAEINIGNSRVMVERGDAAASSHISLYLYVQDCDALYQAAIRAGAKPEQQLTDKIWGDRVGMVRDPFGNVWWIATHKEDVSPAEIGKRAAAMHR
ncbi:MAG TPA: VOC family protein [Candidatus Binataceae bacterium]|nr:VOC family protein [Candidatus Binataceae bacterium]